MSQHPQEYDIHMLLELGRAGPYPLEAYSFVRDGLSYTVDRMHTDAAEAYSEYGEHERHITGQQLCLGLRDFAIERYGLLAPAVLEHWEIRRTDDFGRIVFNMIDMGLMSKTDDDTLEDFRAVYNFGEAFSRDELLARIGES